MPAPVDKKGVQRLLGIVNYIAKFVHYMSTITEPIRQLLKNETQFIWTYEQKAAFERIKEILTKDPVLTYFDVTKPVTVSCDASKSALELCYYKMRNP
jgi:ABC-type multidrug transport system fused ATPase/permease subunit